LKTWFKDFGLKYVGSSLIWTALESTTNMFAGKALETREDYEKADVALAICYVTEFGVLLGCCNNLFKSADSDS